MFLRNQWDVAAESREPSAAPLGRVFLDEPVVLYRQEGGAPADKEMLEAQQRNLDRRCRRAVGRRRRRHRRAAVAPPAGAADRGGAQGAGGGVA